MPHAASDGASGGQIAQLWRPLARTSGCVLIPRLATIVAMDDTTSATQYEVRVRGLLSDRLLSAFPGMHARMRDHETVLTGALPDQSALHGVLGQIEALGLELLDVRRPRARRRVADPAVEAERQRTRAPRPAATCRGRAKSPAADRSLR